LYADRIYPGVVVQSSYATTDLGGRTREDAAQTLTAQYDRYLRTPIAFRYQGREWSAAPRDFGARLDADVTVNAAFQVARDLDRTGRRRARVNGLRDGTTLPPPALAFDDGKLRAFLNGVARDVEKPPALADMSVRGDGAVIVLPSQVGAHLNVNRTA